VEVKLYAFQALELDPVWVVTG